MTMPWDVFAADKDNIQPSQKCRWVGGGNQRTCSLQEEEEEEERDGDKEDRAKIMEASGDRPAKPLCLDTIPPCVLIMVLHTRGCDGSRAVSSCELQNE